MAIKSRVVLALTANILAMSACSHGPSPKITCRELRSLKLGMTETDVRSLLGAPYLTGWPGSDYPNSANVFDYSSSSEHPIRAVNSGGTVLRIIFIDGRLVRASSYYDYEDVGGEKRQLFSFDKAGWHESKWFESAYCPKR